MELHQYAIKENDDLICIVLKNLPKMSNSVWAICSGNTAKKAECLNVVLIAYVDAQKTFIVLMKMKLNCVIHIFFVSIFMMDKYFLMEKASTHMKEIIYTQKLKIILSKVVIH